MHTISAVPDFAISAVINQPCESDLYIWTIVKKLQQMISIQNLLHVLPERSAFEFFLFIEVWNNKWTNEKPGKCMNLLEI